MPIQLRTAVPDDYSQILSHIDLGFGFTPGTFLARFPNHWRHDLMDWEHMYLALEDGKIAAFVRVFVLDVVQNGAEFRVGGIGAVSTAPEARGRGHMSALLDWTNRAMREQGFALAVLSGDRHRYHAYGYEHAGRMLQISIGARGLKRADIPEIEPVLYSGQREVLEKIVASYETQAYRRRRPAQETPWIYASSDFQVYSGESETRFAYLVTCNHTVAEWGGSPKTCLGLVRALQGQGIQSLAFQFPNFEAVPQEFRAAMGRWTIVPSTQIQIVNPELVLKAFDGFPGLPSAAELAAMDVSTRTWALFGGPYEGPLNFFLPLTERV